MSMLKGLHTIDTSVELHSDPQEKRPFTALGRMLKISDRIKLVHPKDSWVSCGFFPFFASH
jgi:hypothetical protein